MAPHSQYWGFPRRRRRVIGDGGRDHQRRNVHAIGGAGAASAVCKAGGVVPAEWPLGAQIYFTTAVSAWERSNRSSPPLGFMTVLPPSCTGGDTHCNFPLY
ncbi:hypothetical protein HPP92_020502 [Vanilla planifolia]|uniref:Uncharacterized protein n=1 Tax=Vanilla planifolia TaxID=51239 RepID=A0A835UJU7_VANPL|nr:hypothetical protein HPP92_020502 [Vanilla planifolia]